jgi:hypothetical protein
MRRGVHKLALGGSILVLDVERLLARARIGENEP